MSWRRWLAMVRRRMLLATAATFVWPGSAAAQAQRSDDQVWASVSGTVPVGRDAELRVDGLVQFVDGASRPGRELLRVVVLAKVGHQLKVGGGYVWTEFAPARGLDLTEHRAVQEISLQRDLLGERLVFASRTQFEERWREGTKGASLRLRQRSRLQAPLGDRDIGVVVWNEYFHEFRATEWSGRSGPSLMVNFAGLHIPLTDRMAIEPGYVHQTLFDRGPNRVRHAAAVFAALRF